MMLGTLRATFNIASNFSFAAILFPFRELAADWSGGGGRGRRLLFLFSLLLPSVPRRGLGASERRLGARRWRQSGSPRHHGRAAPPQGAASARPRSRAAMAPLPARARRPAPRMRAPRLRWGDRGGQRGMAAVAPALWGGTEGGCGGKGSVPCPLGPSQTRQGRGSDSGGTPRLQLRLGAPRCPGCCRPQ